MESENLMENASDTGSFLMAALEGMNEIIAVRGKGLMIGFDLPTEAAPIRTELVFQHIFAGSASGKNTIRLIPPLSIELPDLNNFIHSLKVVFQQKMQEK